MLGRRLGRGPGSTRPYRLFGWWPSMSFGRYRLISQLGAGRDGVRYRAADRADGSAIEMVLLSGARKDPARWASLTRRVRVALMISHPSARRIVGLEMEGSSPYLALEWVDGPSLIESGREESEVIPLTIALASSLAAGHRLGLASARVLPGLIRKRGARPADLVLDWLGLDLGPEEAEPLGGLDASCLAPELAGGGEPTQASDLYALGAILDWRLGGLRDPAGGEASRLATALLDADPSARPPARVVAARLGTEVVATRATQVEASGPVSDSSVTTGFDGEGRATGEDEPPARDRLGRFQLIERLGRGGMGTVYRGLDLADGSPVAVKVLRASLAARPESLLRFYKEARLLAEVDNPRVANYIELNEDEGVHYLVLEYVAGPDLAAWMLARGPVAEREALAILADVARALESAHRRGIVHRDVKPENILIVAEPAGGPDGEPPGLPRAKLSDFGLARHVVESESLVLTLDGAVLGTPLYMAPEQCAGDPEIGPGADVYAMGATLFTLLAGRPPFAGDSPLVVMARHRTEPTPDLRALVPWVSEAAASIVVKAMEKAPAHRYPGAGEMLEDLERLLRGEPTGLEAHPRLPACDPRDLVAFEWRWDLESSPRAHWPLVSNTERFNRAIGLSGVRFDDEPDPDGGSNRTGRLRRAGMEFAWREHPFEWIEGRRMGVVREFERGPFEWFVSVVELSPSAGGGTRLTHRVQVKPRGLVGRAIAAVEIGTKGRKAIDRVYRRVDATLAGKLGNDPVVDPFEPPEPLPAGRRKRLERWLDSLGSRGIAPAVVERIGDYLELATPQEVARIRPLALARRLGLDADPVVDACLRGASEGVLVLLWDILCPACRIPSQVLDTLRTLRDHGHCQACQLDFELDFAGSVELIFRAHPQVRETDLTTYCAGGPAHSPHVAAQARVGVGERFILDLTLEAGSYRFRGPQLPYAIDFRVEPGAATGRWDLDLKRGPEADLPRVLRAGAQSLALANAHDRELLVRVERLAPREDALTAAKASSLALFRELFPGEVLSPGQLIGIDTVTLLVTAPDHPGDLYADLGDARAFAIVLEQFRLIDSAVRRGGGALIKTVHEGTVSAFSDPVAAVRTAMELPALLASGDQTKQLALRVGVHRGPAMVATLNDHLDYFGTTVSVASALPTLAGGGGLVLTRPVASDPSVAGFLAERGLVLSVIEAEVEGLADRFAHRVGPSAPEA